MIILRNKYFSKLQDEDYYDRVERSRKQDNDIATKGIPAVLGITGGSIGSLVGNALGERKRKAGKGALIGGLAGTAAGIAGGIVLGKREKKKINDKYDKERERYKKASEKDKEYLRHKREVEEHERRENMRTAAVAGTIAGK